MYIADALSRDYIECKQSDEVLIFQVHSLASQWNFQEEDVYLQATKSDEIHQELIQYVNHGWFCNNTKFSNEAQKYWTVTFQLEVDNSLLHRLAVPLSLRSQNL